MNEILVKPPELQAAAVNLHKDAKDIQVCIDTVDATIKSLSPAVFEGGRADTLRNRYNKFRDRFYSFKPLIDAFANDLDQAALRFMNGDKN
jgi:uncharacterized protein YukE